MTQSGKFFAHKVPVFVGQLSYSWYLWHWPVYVLLAYTSLTGHLQPGEKVVGILGSFAIGVVSFKFVEPEFRRKDNWWANNTRFASVVAVVWIILITFSTVTWQEEVGGIRAEATFTDEPPPPLFEDQLVVDVADGTSTPGATRTCWLDMPPKAINYSGLNLDTLLGTRQWHKDQHTLYATIDSILEERRVLPAGTASPQYVMMGSSIAATYAPMVERLAVAYNRSIAFHTVMAVAGNIDVPEALAKTVAEIHQKEGGRSGYEGFMKFMYHPEWDAVRMQDLEQWKPETVVWYVRREKGRGREKAGVGRGMFKVSDCNLFCIILLLLFLF